MVFPRYFGADALETALEYLVRELADILGVNGTSCG